MFGMFFSEHVTSLIKPSNPLFIAGESNFSICWKAQCVCDFISVSHVWEVGAAYQRPLSASLVFLMAWASPFSVNNDLLIGQKRVCCLSRSDQCDPRLKVARSFDPSSSFLFLLHSSIFKLRRRKNIFRIRDNANCHIFFAAEWNNKQQLRLCRGLKRFCCCDVILAASIRFKFLGFRSSLVSAGPPPAPPRPAHSPDPTINPLCRETHDPLQPDLAALCVRALLFQQRCSFIRSNNIPAALTWPLLQEASTCKQCCLFSPWDHNETLCAVFCSSSRTQHACWDFQWIIILWLIIARNPEKLNFSVNIHQFSASNSMYDWFTPCLY